MTLADIRHALIDMGMLRAIIKKPNSLSTIEGTTSDGAVLIKYINRNFTALATTSDEVEQYKKGTCPTIKKRKHRPVDKPKEDTRREAVDYQHKLAKRLKTDARLLLTDVNRWITACHGMQTRRDCTRRYDGIHGATLEVRESSTPTAHLALCVHSTDVCV
jgi:hypothetical protein